MTHIVHHSQPGSNTAEKRHEQDPKIHALHRLKYRVLFTQHRRSLLHQTLLFHRRHPFAILFPAPKQRFVRHLPLHVIPRSEPSLQVRVHRNPQRRSQHNEQNGDEHTRHQDARAGDEAIHQEENREQDGNDVEDAEILHLLGVSGGGDGGRKLAEEKDTGETNGEGNDGEHDEEGARVVGEKRGTERSEYRGAQPYKTFQNPRNGSSVGPKVAYARYQNGSVHPRGAVPSHAQKNAHLRVVLPNTTNSLVNQQQDSSLNPKPTKLKSEKLLYKCLYLPIRKGLDSLAHNQPLGSVSYEAFHGAYKENGPSGEAVGGQARQKPKGFSDVFSHGEVVEFQLREMHEGFERVGVIGEGVVVAGDALNPDGGHEAQPFSGG